jgi:hypothetical protein
LRQLAGQDDLGGQRIARNHACSLFEHQQIDFADRQLLQVDSAPRRCGRA